MKTFLIASVSALLLASAGAASAHSTYETREARAPIYGTWMADVSAMPSRQACGGYGYAFGGGMRCETATGGPVGGINN
jgi:opacity protein-like surface antigen